MKKILLFLSFVFAFVLISGSFNEVAAQDLQSKILDSTMTNAGTASATVTITGSKSNVSFGYVITKTSGTVGGTIVLQGSIDGTNYSTIDTYTLTDASANVAKTYDYNAYQKYKVIVTTTGTQVSNHKIWVLYRK